MTTIGFVRHGITAWNKEGREQGSSDISLDEEGIQMSRCIADRLAKEDWDIVYTSPLMRAKQTAELIVEKKPSMDLVIDNRIREIGSGLIEGTTEAERIEKWGQSWRSLGLGFESREETIVRGLAFIEEISRAHSGKRVLVVSHGSFIVELVEALIPTGNLGIALDNTSLTIIQLKKDQNICILYNCTKHLS